MLVTADANVAPLFPPGTPEAGDVDNAACFGGYECPGSACRRQKCHVDKVAVCTRENSGVFDAPAALAGVRARSSKAPETNHLRKWGRARYPASTDFGLH